MRDIMHTTAIVLAGGSGSRMGGKVKKQYMDLDGHPILWYSLSAFEHSTVDEIVLVCSADDIREVSDTYTAEFSKVKTVVPGGRERYHSVYAGLCACTECDYVLIHDGARPFVDETIINRCLDTLKGGERACVAAMPSKDTVKIADDDGYAESTPDRSRVWIIQTPQCFEYATARSAYESLIEAEKKGELGKVNVTDDAMVAEMYTDAKVRLIEGSYNNIKITTPEDLAIAREILKV